MTTYGRTRLNDRLTPTHIQIESSNGVSVTSSTVVPTTRSQGATQTMSDFLTPGFRKRMPEGRIVMNDCLLERYERETSLSDKLKQGPYSYWGGAYDTFEGDLTGCVEASVGFEGLPSLELDQIASNHLVKCYSKMFQSAVMSGEIMSDLSRTVSSLRHPFAASRDLLSKIHKRRHRWASRSKNVANSASDLAKASADAWLEYRYGWKPLLMDADAIFSSAIAIVSQAERKVVRSTGNDTSFVTRSFQDVPVSALGWQASGSVNLSKKGSGSAGILYEVKNITPASKLASILGTRASDLLPLAWELIPYSFVVDWFTNTGDWLQAISPAPGITPLASWTTTVEEYEYHFLPGILKRTFYVPNPDACTAYYSGSHSKYVTFKRVANPSMPSTPVVTALMPSQLHCVDGLALSAGKILQSLSELRR